MNIEEALYFVEKLVIEERGKGMSDLERAIVKGSWLGQTYSEIAEAYYSKPKPSDHIARNVAPKLWALLSRKLGEKVGHKQLQGPLERAKQQAKLVPQFQGSGQSQEPNGHTAQNDSGSGLALREEHIDLSEAPDVSMSTFYGREDELTILEQWIVNDRCRLVVVSGIPGIGKSFLARRLADEIKDKFEEVIWRSLKDAPPVEEILAELLQFLSNQQKTKSDLPEQVGSRVSRLLEYLRRRRCLLLLDAVESILQQSAPAGRYREGYEEYSKLLKPIGEQDHHSCLVLIGRELPREIASIAGETLPVRTLPLGGLQEKAANKILQAKNLVEPNRWGELIERYGGNPLALHLVSTTIKELCGGRVSEVLRRNTTLLTNDLTEPLDLLFCRCLTDLEKEIMYWLVIEEEPVSLSELDNDISSSVSFTNLVEAMQSLCLRSLIENRESLFTLQPVVKSYVKERLVEQFFLEIEELRQNPNLEELNILRKYDLTKNHKNKIIATVKGRICKPYRSQNNLIIPLNELLEILVVLREQSQIKMGYAEVNLESIIADIKSDLNKP
jgi:AAA+ ATPase superfamily predicted ATPase